MDDIACPILALRQILFFVWVTLSERKWVILAERRGASPYSGEDDGVRSLVEASLTVFHLRLYYANFDRCQNGVFGHYADYELDLDRQFLPCDHPSFVDGFPSQNRRQGCGSSHSDAAQRLTLLPNACIELAHGIFPLLRSTGF